MNFSKHNPYDNQSCYAEEQGLKLINAHISEHDINELNVPKVLRRTKDCIELEMIEGSTPSYAQWRTLGEGLAKLHSASHKHYGLSYNNYIGLNPQANTEADSWGEFFISHRLIPQIDLMSDVWFQSWAYEQVENNKSKIVDLLNEHCEHASLVHGDLWSGNVMFSKDKVWLIDPAVYYGDSEVDIAMTELFGGFSPDFYSSYQKVKPLSKAYKKKKCVYNLYHYLNHLNLFGSSYKAQCKESLGHLNEI